MATTTHVECSGPQSRYANRQWSKVWHVAVEDSEGCEVGRSYDCQTQAAGEALAATLAAKVGVPVQHVDLTLRYENARREARTLNRR